MGSLEASEAEAVLPRRARATAVAGLLGHAALAASWLWVSAASLAWIGRSLCEPGRLTSLVLCACAAALLATRLGPLLRSVDLDVQAPPRMRFLPVALVAACAIAQASRAGLLELNVVRAVVFIIGCWAFTGLYLPARAWRRGLLAALLGAALLPLSEHLDAYLGLPLRIAIARVVQGILAPLGIAAHSSEAILVLENGVADIDLPCSGVKGLWVGGLYFVSLTGLERRAMGARWLLAGAAYLSALLGANLLRVLVLVLVAVAARAPRAAAIVHLPLGVAGFVGASALATLLLRRHVGAHRPEAGEPRGARARPGRPVAHSWSLALVLAALMGALGWRGGAAPARVEVGPASALRLPPEIALEPVELDARERALFSSHGGRSAGKWVFRAGGLRGSLLVVVADSFRAHHAPEVCLAGAGRRVDGVAPAEVDAGFPVRVVSVDRGQATAIYWFQSPSATTGAILDRTLAEMTGRERRWALVSMIFEGNPPANAAAAWPLVRQVRDATARVLTSNVRTDEKEGGT